MSTHLNKSRVQNGLPYLIVGFLLGLYFARLSQFAEVYKPSAASTSATTDYDLSKKLTEEKRTMLQGNRKIVENIVKQVEGGDLVGGDIYFEHNQRIKEFCGELCTFPQTLPASLSQKVNLEYLQKSMVKVPIDCERLFDERLTELLDMPAKEWPPPKEVPKSVYSDFTFDGRISITSWYFQQRYSGSTSMTPVWKKEQVEEIIETVKSGKPFKGSYGVASTTIFIEEIKKLNLNQVRALVVGSEVPWVEAILLAFGAREVTTLEYGSIISEHPQIQTMVPKQFNEAFRKGTLPQFDIAVSYSSAEHSGLGRYGDSINPWGDIISIARVSCVVKPDGLLSIAVPYLRQDQIAWNAHRYYGPFRFPRLLTNWEPVQASDNRGGHSQLLVTSKNKRIDI